MQLATSGVLAADTHVSGYVHTALDQRTFDTVKQDRRSASPSPSVRLSFVALAVGDVVVYGSHGIGRVRARQKQIVLGVEREMVEVELVDGMTVTLPIGRAQEQLRPLATESDLRRVQATLRKGRALDPDAWTKRREGARKKLSEGDPVGLAELVRDGAQRERGRSGKGANSRLSTSEDELSAKARQLLAAEVALARGVQPAEADAWIEEQLSKAS